MHLLFLTALRVSFPALLCNLPLGIVYGVICTQSGYPWFYAPLFSAFVLAGAMQFLALSLLSAGSSLFTIAIAIIPLGIRNIFYGIAMLDRYRSAPPLLRGYLAHGLVDTTFSLLITQPSFDSKKDCHYITYLTLLIHLYWVLGSLLGSFITKWITLPDGLEFSLTAFFAASATEQFLKNKDWKGIAIAVSSIVFAAWLAPSYFFITSIGVAILICLAVPYEERRCA